MKTEKHRDQLNQKGWQTDNHRGGKPDEQEVKLVRDTQDKKL